MRTIKPGLLSAPLSIELSQSVGIGFLIQDEH